MHIFLVSILLSSRITQTVGAKASRDYSEQDTSWSFSAVSSNLHEVDPDLWEMTQAWIVNWVEERQTGGAPRVNGLADPKLTELRMKKQLGRCPKLYPCMENVFHVPRLCPIYGYRPGKVLGSGQYQPNSDGDAWIYIDRCQAYICIMRGKCMTSEVVDHTIA